MLAFLFLRFTLLTCAMDEQLVINYSMKSRVTNCTKSIVCTVILTYHCRPVGIFPQFAPHKKSLWDWQRLWKPNISKHILDIYIYRIRTLFLNFIVRSLLLSCCKKLGSSSSSSRSSSSSMKRELLRGWGFSCRLSSMERSDDMFWSGRYVIQDWFQ